MKYLVSVILLLVSLSVFSQKKIEDCIALIKKSYEPLEVFLHPKESHTAFIEYEILHEYLQGDVVRKNKEKVKMYIKEQNTLAIVGNKKVYRQDGNIITIDGTRKQIIVAKDIYKTYNKEQMIARFFSSRDTVFSFIEDYKYSIVKEKGRRFTKISCLINTKGQKGLGIKSITWLLDSKGFFYSMDIINTKGALFLSSKFKLLSFETNIEHGFLEEKVLDSIFLKKGVVSKPYVSYKIIDYRK